MAPELDGCYIKFKAGRRGTGWGSRHNWSISLFSSLRTAPPPYPHRWCLIISSCPELGQMLVPVVTPLWLAQRVTILCLDWPVASSYKSGFSQHGRRQGGISGGEPAHQSPCVTGTDFGAGERSWALELDGCSFEFSLFYLLYLGPVI